MNLYNITLDPDKKFTAAQIDEYSTNVTKKVAIAVYGIIAICVGLALLEGRVRWLRTPPEVRSGQIAHNGLLIPLRELR